MGLSMNNNRKFKKVSIILLNYNTSNDLIECINSLENIDYPNYEIIVIDNCSNKNEIRKLESYLEKREKCIFIKNDKNTGFAGGNNLGIKYALENKTDYILLLNSDTLVNENFLSVLVDTAEKDKENIAMVTGKILYYPNVEKVWYGGGYIDWGKFIGKHYGEGEYDNGQYNEIKSITFSSGCLMLINASLNFEKYLPEEYFMYYEDVDYCAKILNNGFKIMYNPNAVIYHKIGSSSGGEQSEFTIRWANRGRYIFMNKYKNKVSPFKFIIIKMKFLITRFIKIMLMCMTGEFKKANSLYKGLLDGILKK